MRKQNEEDFDISGTAELKDNGKHPFRYSIRAKSRTDAEGVATEWLNDLHSEDNIKKISFDGMVSRAIRKVIIKDDGTEVEIP